MKAGPVNCFSNVWMFNFITCNDPSKR